MTEKTKIDTERELFKAWLNSQTNSESEPERVYSFDEDGLTQLTTESMWHAWQGRASIKPTVPAGWQPVPIEPTQEMLCAGVKEQHGPAVYKVVSNAGCSVMEGEQYANYAAMLKAAPTPPQGEPS